MLDRLPVFQILVLIILGLNSNSTAAEPGDVRWRMQFDGAIWPSLAVDNNLLMFGSDDHNFYAVNVETQSITWQFATQDKIRSKADVHGGMVTFASDDGFLYALDIISGELQWKFQLEKSPIRRRALAVGYDYRHASPVYHDGILYIGTASGFVFAIDHETGREIWKTRVRTKIRADVVIAEDVLFVSNWAGKITELSLSTGDVMSTVQVGGIIHGTPLVHDDILFAGSRAAKFYALDLNTRQYRWDHPDPEGSWIESSPVIDNGVLYWGTSDAFVLQALDPETGQPHWQFETGGWTWAKPFVDEEVVYIGAISCFPYYFEGVSLESGFFAIDKQSGELLWRMNTEVIDGFVTGGVHSSPVIIGDTVYVAALDGILYAVQK